MIITSHDDAVIQQFVIVFSRSLEVVHSGIATVFLKHRAPTRSIFKFMLICSVTQKFVRHCRCHWCCSGHEIPQRKCNRRVVQRKKHQRRTLGVTFLGSKFLFFGYILRLTSQVHYLLFRHYLSRSVHEFALLFYFSEFFYFYWKLWPICGAFLKCFA